MPARETVGIHPIIDSTKMAADIQTFTVPIAGEKLQHTFLAKQQKTQYAVISVHTTEEKELFKRLMQDQVDIGQGTTLDWRSAGKTWNQSANRKTIFYKVSKQFSINIYAMNILFIINCWLQIHTPRPPASYHFTYLFTGSFYI
jgi:hypothetical protein